MTPETVTLLQEGALTLVNLMATDAWTQIRTRFARMLSRGDAGEEVLILERLDTAQREVATARAAQDAQGLADIEGEWRQALRRALAADPALADELRCLVKEVGAPSSGGTRVTASGTFHNSPVQGTGTQSITYGPATNGGTSR